MADRAILSKHLSSPQSTEQRPSHEEDPSNPFHMKHDEDDRIRDISVYGINYSKPLRNSLDSSDDKSLELKCFLQDRDDRLIDTSNEAQAFLPRIRNYRRQKLSRSPSPSPEYLGEDFRELEIARRRREEELLSRKLSEKLPSSSYMLPSLSNSSQSSEPRHLYRPEDAPAMPKKSILKKHVADPSVQV